MLKGLKVRDVMRTVEAPETGQIEKYTILLMPPNHGCLSAYHVDCTEKQLKGYMILQGWSGDSVLAFHGHVRGAFQANARDVLAPTDGNDFLTSNHGGWAAFEDLVDRKETGA